MDIAINHDPAAIAMHRANHPTTEHYTEDVWKVDPVEACAGRLSVATTLNRAEAVRYIRDLIENKIKKGLSADDAVRGAFVYVTETYLTRPLGVFDKRTDVDMKGGGC